MAKDIFDEVFSDEHEHVSASATGLKDSGKSVKFGVAPAGNFEDDAAWMEAAEAEGLVMTRVVKSDNGRSRKKTLKPRKVENRRKAASDVLGVSKNLAKGGKGRGAKADTMEELEPSENGAAE